MWHERGHCQDANQLEGKYANYFKVGHNALEFVIDFGQFYSDNGEVQLHTRIVTNPTYAKAMLATLRESIDKHEREFDAISTSNE
ncbi:MAG: DUF3467 domain-containing protein [Gammaproteobacteria bacterium]